ncbi:T-cell surface glycoprotein CD3 delta chain [Talpa occidentalis]|uniref:T-cell surface glycoprotein CD3 delta chain n=1 Tax=Talpa occidentalis TaxID=50954 RepID=UPI00188F29BD|nr:T-cell surface glycoprotein CD3 delta chain [Talpa occidentalis]
MEHSGFLSGLVLAAFLFQVSSSAMEVKEIEEMVFLICNNTNGTIEKIIGTERTLVKNYAVHLGKRMLDPRGLYECKNNSENNKDFLQIHYRMCQNCVELDSGTLSGIVVSDIIATLLLALGIYCFAGHETGRLSAAADTQVLMRNDQLYQPLRERNNDQYSSLGENWHRNK